MLACFHSAGDRGLKQASRLLPPRLVEIAGIDAAEADLVRQRHGDRFRGHIVARDGKRYSVITTGTVGPVDQIASFDGVERLDHRAKEHTFGPAALDGTIFEGIDNFNAQVRDVIAGVDVAGPR